jgi:hypothetical protein
MSSIPVDVFRTILEHVEELADLVALCQVNKICCSCSQDVLYRDISAKGDEGDDRIRVIQTLAHSTDLARRVRSFHAHEVHSYHTHEVRSFYTHRVSTFYTHRFHPKLYSALRNMSSLRRLRLTSVGDASILDGCTFKLDSFISDFSDDVSLRTFLNSQPSLTEIRLYMIFKFSSKSSPFEETCLPNLTQVTANGSWLPILIPGRPVREVTIHNDIHLADFDFSVFTLSTAPIQKLRTSFTFLNPDYLHPKSRTLLACVFPSLVHLSVNVDILDFYVRTPLYLFI